LSGNTIINEITINGDAASVNPTLTGTSNPPVAWATITVSNMGDNANVKLSLRSTSALDYVKTAWQITGDDKALILKGASGYTLKSSDVAKFHLKEFKSSNGAQVITGFKISDAGKLVVE